MSGYRGQGWEWGLTANRQEGTLGDHGNALTLECGVQLWGSLSVPEITELFLLKTGEF